MCFHSLKEESLSSSGATTFTATELKEFAEQVEVELSILLGIEQSIRRALQWMTRDRGNAHKLETLRFAARSFERHLTRTRVLADDGGYMHAITDANPHLAGDVKELKSGREALQVNFERIILQLEYVSPDNAAAFGQICIEMEHYFDDLEAHGQKEMSLLQHSFVQEEGGSG
jgi:hypothetical protein